MRRWFTGAVAAITIAWPLGGQAQQLPPKVGFLGPASPEPYSHILEAFREGLKDTIEWYLMDQAVRADVVSAGLLPVG